MRISVLAYIFFLIAAFVAEPAQATGQQAAIPSFGDAPCALVGICNLDGGQTSGPSIDPVASPVSLKGVVKSLPADQKALWTSPFRMHQHDLFWVVPLAATSGVLIGSDSNSMRRVRTNPDAITLSKRVSDAGVAGVVAFPAAFYLWGSITESPRSHEAGLLSGEALINSFAVTEALKLAFARQRPTEADGQGGFFRSVGADDSFPSTHAALAWTAASVMAHEYPGTVPEALFYGSAAAVSISRVTARQHFPSDVIVGSALGWLIGRQVYKSRHNQELDAEAYGDFGPTPGEPVAPETLGSPYVPLDSWVYSALERLASVGFIKSQFVGLKPWTQAECERQVEEAEYFAQSLGPDSDVVRTIRALKAELHEQPTQRYSASIDSLYWRHTQIAGTPLRDSYHFGQTLWDDFGRPFDEGGNIAAGAEARAVAGPTFFYVKGEYQHAPGRGAFTLAQRELIAALDTNPLLPAESVSQTNRFYPLDVYAGVKLAGYSLTFGKQSLWLGPTENGPLMMSSNADPMYMLRLSRTTPLILPGVLRWLGEVRGEFLISKLSGHQFPQRPFFNLQKISFHPTDNLELGFTRSSIWAGVGHPFTAHSLLRNFGSVSDTFSNSLNRNDPGDRKSGFDFEYRVPGLRRWLTVYSDMYSDDDPSPLAAPRRAAVSPGFYIPRFPMVAKLDFRGELTSTQLLATDQGPNFIYINNQYHDANTNKGNIFGSSVGRDARAYTGTASYHFTATNRLSLNYRQLKVSSRLLPDGGTQTDASAKAEWQVRAGLTASAFVQAERWLIPALSARAERNVTGQIEIRYTPRWHFSVD